MKLENKPVEIISKFNCKGDIVPMRMRIENEDHCLITVNIENILYAKDNHYAGINTIDFGCKTVIEERERFIELRYHVAAHKWVISRILY